jgi:hypothetical protein
MSEIEVLRQEPKFAAFVGIDWADQKHAWGLQAAGATQRENGEVEHRPEAVEAWVGQLCRRFGNRPIAVAVEQVKGALVFMLSKYEPLHLFPVPPAMSAKMRQALYPSGSKDDPRDADLLLELVDRKIEEAAAAHPEFFIFESLPGAGAALAPRLLTAFGSQRDRYANAEDVQSYSGIAPVTEGSGKKKWIHFRWACPKFLRQSFHESAGHSIAHSQWARSYYQQQRERGKGHHAAVRGLAFKWIRIVFRCWKDGVVYDESRYREALAKRNSPLAAVAGTIL